ncbi:MAG TPA: hypothetical protein GX526_00450 [Thermoanaerobacterales bacterium]|nr:hypothetical protein [Thermoanaerobacterales bacterium]
MSKPAKIRNRFFIFLVLILLGILIFSVFLVENNIEDTPPPKSKLVLLDKMLIQ